MSENHAEKMRLWELYDETASSFRFAVKNRNSPEIKKSLEYMMFLDTRLREYGEP